MRNTFGRAPIFVASVLESASEAVAGRLKPGFPIDEIARVADETVLAGFEAEHLGQCLRSRRKPAELVGRLTSESTVLHTQIIKNRYCFRKW